VADEDPPLLAEVVEDRDQVAGEVVDVVGLDVVGPARPAVAALVEGNGPVAGGGQGGDLVAPGVGEIREAVDQHDREPVASLDDVQLDVAACDRPGPLPGRAPAT
jgi:hypothetical protein